MWFSEFMEALFKELLLRKHLDGKTYVVPPKLAFAHNPLFPWK